MWIIDRYRCLVVIVSVHFRSTLSEGKDTTVLTAPRKRVTTAVEDKPQFMTDLRHTTTGCAEQSNGRHRRVMCHVIHDICLTVFVGSRNLTPRDQCAAENTSHVADFTSIEILKPCLAALLQLPPVPIVRLGETRYIDTRNWTDVHPQSPYRVPCLIAKQQLDSTRGNLSESQGVAWKIWVIVGVLTVVPTISAVVLVYVFFKKKANLKETSGRREPEGHEAEQQQEAEHQQDLEHQQEAGHQQKAEHQQEAEHQQDEGYQREAEHQHEASRLQCQEVRNTTDLYDQESGRFITNDDLVYTTVVNASKQINRRSQGGEQQSKHECDDVEYITLDIEKTGKLLVADEEENKDDDSGEERDTQQ